MAENIYTDIMGGLILAALLVIITLLILYCYVFYKFKKESKTVTAKKFIISFFEKNILEKLEMNMFDNDVYEGENASPPSGGNIEEIANSFSEDTAEGNTDSIFIEEIHSARESDVLGSKVLKRQSRNYGKDETFSIRTWYGINYSKLIKEGYNYICFIVKEENERVYLKVDDILTIIDNNILPEEREKYIKRNSFDTYLMKSLKDEKWYITRMGVHFEKPIEIDTI
ncbi:hypothetical protein BCR22_05680 [Enterococcus plantarum]|uniref:hypothetical protein n=1 Tax=Enterococcus plantarum TaxID=1077675 RepID=UPI00084D0780|nr:hypothetical protein [Enterococcus plantarum]OEG11211.1 hypothetical protein BCR22_05680 [Enterococcus plantarum]